MKLHYRIASGRMTFEIQGESQKAIFKEIAAIQEIFEAESKCGVCGCTDIRTVVRTVGANDFYELRCLAPACRARFEFGQNRQGGSLFPKRKAEDGTYLPNRGWAKYEAPANGK